VVLPLLIFAVLALLSACTEADGRHDKLDDSNSPGQHVAR
jgi:hypothetical protein